jgi:hypothetical protein
MAYTSGLGQTPDSKLGCTVRRSQAITCSYDVSHVIAYYDRTRRPFLPAAEHAPGGHPQVNTCQGKQ